MDKLSGKCVGGPHDGRQLAHIGSVYKVAFIDYDKMALGKMVDPDTPITDEISHAEYRFDDGVWKWQANT